jgi:UDP-N-acetyl-D-mannosaminuronate dehydrogenase
VDADFALENEGESLVEVSEVGVVGVGYVGLDTGACLALVGHWGTCLDKDEGRIAGLEQCPKL